MGSYEKSVDLPEQFEYCPDFDLTYCVVNPLDVLCINETYIHVHMPEHTTQYIKNDIFIPIQMLYSTLRFVFIERIFHCLLPV